MKSYWHDPHLSPLTHKSLRDSLRQRRGPLPGRAGGIAEQGGEAAAGPEAVGAAFGALGDQRFRPRGPAGPDVGLDQHLHEQVALGVAAAEPAQVVADVAQQVGGPAVVAIAVGGGCIAYGNRDVPVDRGLGSVGLCRPFDARLQAGQRRALSPVRASATA